jgi:hypothetical protein
VTTKWREIGVGLRGEFDSEDGAASSAACPDAGAELATTPGHRCNRKQERDSCHSVPPSKFFKAPPQRTPSASLMLFGLSLFWHDKCDHAFVEGLMVRVNQKKRDFR